MTEIFLSPVLCWVWINNFVYVVMDRVVMVSRLDSKIASYLGIALLYIAAGLALWSLALYMKGIWGFLSK